MCIRDSYRVLELANGGRLKPVIAEVLPLWEAAKAHTLLEHCLLYTSDAADERSSVDLGGRRIIKKQITLRDTRLHQISP